MDIPATNDEFEVKIITARRLDQVIISNVLVYSPNAGDTFLELGIRVTNLKPDTHIKLEWGDFYVIDGKNLWVPNFLGYKPVKQGVQLNPAELVFDTNYQDEKRAIEFDEVVFIRAIWALANTKPLVALFQFQTAQTIKIEIP